MIDRFMEMPEDEVVHAVSCVFCPETLDDVCLAAQADGVDMIEFIASAIDAAVLKSLAAYRIREKQSAH